MYENPFEIAVLQAVNGLKGKGYGKALREVTSELLGREVSLSAVHATLARVEGKGFVRSRLSASTPVPGGKRRRLYRVTKNGEKALKEARAAAMRLWGI